MKQIAAERVELTMTIGGEQRLGGGEPIDVVQPHRKDAVLGTLTNATAGRRPGRHRGGTRRRPGLAARCPTTTGPPSSSRPPTCSPGRGGTRSPRPPCSGQSKTCYQAEIDTPCELVDFWRFNVHFGRQILDEQPISSPGVWNRFDHRPLEGFVLAITPFNFTAIAGNLPTAPALMGNTVLWKPAPTQQLAAHYTMRLLEAAGPAARGDQHGHRRRPRGQRGRAGASRPGRHPLHRLHRDVRAPVAHGHGEPDDLPDLPAAGRARPAARTSSSRIPSADVDVLRTALIRGAFEFQGQKCSAASRAYLPRSVWSRMRDGFIDEVNGLPMGDVTDFSNFLGAVIDQRSFDRLTGVLDRVRGEAGVEILAGGTADDSEGYFIRPTVVQADNPAHEVFTTEYFGPILGVFVYDDADYDRVIREAADIAPYGLTGAVIAQDRAAIVEAMEVLRFSAGNFYINDKPTGAVVGQQPFGGARASGTNDKAGSVLNLLRWVSPRSIKETFVPATDYRYPHMG